MADDKESEIVLSSLHLLDLFWRLAIGGRGAGQSECKDDLITVSVRVIDKRQRHGPSKRSFSSWF